MPQDHVTPTKNSPLRDLLSGFYSLTVQCPHEVVHLRIMALRSVRATIALVTTGKIFFYLFLLQVFTNVTGR